MDLTASTSEILVVVEGLPESKQRLGTGLGTGIKQNANLGVKDAAESGEEPTMRVDLLAVLLLKTEHHLHRGQCAGAVVVGADQLLVGRHRQLSGVLENVRSGLLAVNVPLHDTVLVDTNGGQEIKRALVAGVDTIENEANDNLLPSWAALVPELGLLQVDNVADVLHDTVEGTRGKHLVFVVVGDGDEQLSVSVVHGRAQIVAVLQREVVGVARGSRV